MRGWDGDKLLSPCHQGRSQDFGFEGLIWAELFWGLQNLGGLKKI